MESSRPAPVSRTDRSLCSWRTLAFGLFGLVLGTAQAVDLELGRLEAAVYSLPNVRARADFGIEEEAFLVSEFQDPVLSFPWRSLDHSQGVNATGKVLVRLFEDTSFPVGPAPVWKEVVDKTSMLDNQHRAKSQAHFDREGRLRIPLELTPARPIRRLKVRLESEVDTSFAKDQAEEERSFYITLRPTWKTRKHHHPALMQFVQMAYNRKRAVWQWKQTLREVALSNRSLKDARKFGPEAVQDIFEHTKVISLRALDDSVIEQVVDDFLGESGKAMGKLRFGIDALSPELLGAKRPQISFRAAAEASFRAGNEALKERVDLRNMLIALKAVGESTQARRTLDRILYHLDRQLEALNHLWYVPTSAELAMLLSRWEENLRLENMEWVELGKRLETELGRNYRDHSWGPIEDSPLFQKHLPSTAFGRAASASLARAIWQGLYYMIRSEHFSLQVLAEAAKKAREGFELNSPKVKILPEFEAETLPPHLQVAANITGTTIRPGQLADYPITVRNLDNSPREVVLREVGPLPSGWFSGFSEREFQLEPGESKTVHYTITSPFYLQDALQVQSAIRVYFDDEPSRYHEPKFMTLSTTGEGLPNLANASSHLEIDVLNPEMGARPGDVLKYSFLVTHHGPTKKLVSAELVSPAPEGWVVVMDPERLWLEPEEQARIDLRVTAPLYMKDDQREEWVVAIAYADEMKNEERIAFTTVGTTLESLRSEPHINDDMVRSYEVEPGASQVFDLAMDNRGNIDDTFDFFLDVPPDGWYIRMVEPFIALPAKSPPNLARFKVQAPIDAQAGDHVEIQVTALSATHPEIRTQKSIRLIVAGDSKLKMRIHGQPFAVAPGDELHFTFEAENCSERPMDVGFRAAGKSSHSEWIQVEVPVTPIEPGEIREMEGVLRLPDTVRLGETFEFQIAGVNELGYEVASEPVVVQAARRREVDLVLDDDRTLVSKGLIAAKLLVTNTGTVPDTIQLFLSGLKRRYWARLSAARVQLAPGETEEVTVFVRIPPTATPDQDAVVVVQAKSALDSGARDWVSVTVHPNGGRSRVAPKKPNLAP